MDQSVTTIQHQTERYGHHVRLGKKSHRPAVYKTQGGYRIVPWDPTSRNQIFQDDFDKVLEDEKPVWIELLEILTMAIMPVYLVFARSNSKRYARKFWIKNGFDPDSLANYY